MASLANTEITNTFDVWRRNTNEVTDRLNSITTSGEDNRITLTGNVEVGGTNFVVDSGTNRVGVGTSTPAVKLDVVGETNISADLKVDTDTLYVNSTTDRVGINNATPTEALDVTGKTLISDDLMISGAASNVLFVDTSNSSIGINVDAPTAGSLEVSGNVVLQNSDSLRIKTSDGTLQTVLTANTSNSTILQGSGGTESIVLASSNGTSRITMTEAGVASFSANAIFDTDTLYVDSVNDSVGINIVPTVSSSLEVGGNVVLQNTDELQIKNNGGTSQTVLTVNASDSTILQGSGGTESVAVKSSDGTSRITMTEAGVTAFSSNATFDTDTLFVDTINDSVGINIVPTVTASLEVGGNVVLQNTDELRIKSSDGTVQTVLTVNTSNSTIIQGSGGTGGTESVAIKSSDGTSRITMTEAGVTAFTANVSIPDNEILFIGNDNDLRIFHNGSDSYIKDLGTGNFYLDSDGPGLYLRVNSTQTAIAAVNTGEVSLRYATAEKLGTTSAGVNITGTATISSLTDNRITFAGTAGVLEDSTDLTFDGTTFEIGGGYGGTGVDIDMLGNISADGNIISDGTVTVVGLSSLDGGIDVNAAAFTVSAAGAVDTSSTLTVDGLSSLDGGIDVDGVFTVADVTGNINTTGTLTVGGLSSLDGGIDVDGAFTVADATGNISTSGTLRVTNTTDSSSTSTGSVAISGGLGVAKKLFVGTTTSLAGQTTIGGGYGSTGTTITDAGNISTDGTLTVDGTTTAGIVNLSGLLSADAGIDVDGVFTVADTTGNIATSGTLNVTNTTDSTSSSSGAAVITGGLGVGKDLFVGANTNITGSLTVDGDTVISGNVIFGDATTDSITLTADIHSDIIPNASDSYNLGSSGKKWEDIYVDDVIADTGAFTGAVGIDGNFDINTNKFTVNATTGDVAVAGTLDVTGVSTLSNDLAVDTNTLFVDASTDSVGINTNTPAAAVSLEVSGDVLLQNTDEVKIKNFAGTSQTVLSVNASDSTIIQGSGGTESVAIKSSDGTSRITMTEAGVTAFVANTVVDTDTLFVDSVNDRVGVNTSSPGFDLDVVGDVNLSGVIKAGGSSTADYYLKVNAAGNGMEYVDIQAVLSGNSIIRGPATAPFPNVIGDERDITMWQSNTVITGNTNMLTYDLSTGQLNVKSNGQTSSALSIQDSTNHAEFEKDDSLLSIRSGSGSGSILFSGATDSTNIGNFQVRSGGANQDIYHTGNLEVTELSRLVNTTTTSTAGNYYEIIRWDPTNLPDTAVVLTLLITSNRSDSNDYNGSCSALVQVSLVQNDAASGNKIDPDIQLLSYSSYGSGSTENIIEDILVATDIPAAFEAIQSVYIKSNIAGEIFTVQLLSESKTGSSVPDVSYPSSSWTTVPSNIQAQTGKIVRQSADFLPKRDSVYDLGSNTERWANIYADTFTGTLNNTLTLNTSGTGLTGSTTYNNSGAATFTVTSDATDADTNGAIVARNASTGGFSAGPITADSFTASTGSIILNGTGRIQGIDTVTDSTDAANKAYVDAQLTAQDLDFAGDTGGTLSVDLDSQTFTIAGGEGIDTSGSGQTLTVAVDLTELTDMTDPAVAADELILLDGGFAGVQRRKPFSEIDIGIFNTTNQIALATDTTGNYVNSITGGNGISSTGATTGENISHTLSVDLTDTNIFASDGTVSRAVVLDGSGDFSAGTITASLSGTATNATNFNVAADNTTAAEHYVIFTDGATGNQRPNSDTALTYNPSTDTLTAGKVDITGTSGLLFNGTAVTATATELNVLDGIPGTLTATELGYVDGVTSSIQTQLNAKVESLGDLGVTATAAELNELDGIGTPTDGGIVYGDGTGLKVTAAGTTGQYLRSAGTGIPIWDTINLGTDTDGNYMVDASGGSGITVTHTPSEGSTATIAVDLTDTNIFTSTSTGSRAVVRDSSGNFSAGTITASLSGTATTATNVTTTDNTTTNETVYVAFVDGTSGGQGIEVDSTGLTYNPSTDTLTTGDVNISNGIQVNGVSGVNGQMLAANTTGGIEWRDDVEVYNHTWAVGGDVTATTLPCMFVLTGNTAGYDEVVKFSRYRAKITGGTSVDVKFQKNGVDIPNSSATITTAKQTVSSFTANTMINEDELTIVTSSPSGSPVNLSVTAFFTRQRFV